MYPAVVVEASTAGPPHHHRWGALTTLVLVAGAALLVAPIVAGLQRTFDAPEPAPLGLHRSASMPQAEPAPAAGEPEDDTAVFEQFIELDEVLITSTDEDELEGER